MKKFGELKREEKVALFEAWVYGKTIQLFVEAFGWQDVDPKPSWRDEVHYRIKPEEKVPDCIDWSHVHPDYKWLARNDSGRTCLFTRKPALMKIIWEPRLGCKYVRAEGFASYKRGTVDWTDSLVQRPEGV